MLHAVFQTAQIMPMNTRVGAKTLSPTPSLPIPKLNSLQPITQSAAVKLRLRSLAVRASAAEVESDSVALLERCFVAPAAPASFDSCLPSSCSAPSTFSSSLGPVMKGQYSSLGTVTLEKSKLDLAQKQTKSSPEVSAAFLYLHISCQEIRFENVEFEFVDFLESLCFIENRRK